MTAWGLQQYGEAIKSQLMNLLGSCLDLKPNRSVKEFYANNNRFVGVGFFSLHLSCSEICCYASLTVLQTSLDVIAPF